MRTAQSSPAAGPSFPKNTGARQRTMNAREARVAGRLLHIERIIMAGHSKWANIQHRKGRQDAKRSNLWTKLVREIIVAARMAAAIRSPTPVSASP